jgi:hypothetical protein
MKKILILFLILMSHYTLGKIPESEIQKLKPDVDEDYVVVFQKGEKSRLLKDTLLLYDNNELKGDPIFSITPDEILSGVVHYKFIDSILGSCEPSCKYKFIPIDFMRIFNKQVAVAVKDYKNEIARVENNKKSYYFKFTINQTTRYKWRTYKKKENFKKILEEDPSYLLFANDLKKCIKLKDVKCLEPFLDEVHLTSDKILINAKRRAVYDDKKLCKGFNSIRSSNNSVGVDDVPNELIQEIKNVDFVWDKLANALSSSNENSYSITVKNFGIEKHIQVSRNLSDDTKSCGQTLDINLELYKQKDNSWKIISFDLYAFTY